MKRARTRYRVSDRILNDPAEDLAYAIAAKMGRFGLRLEAAPWAATADTGALAAGDPSPADSVDAYLKAS